MKKRKPIRGTKRDAWLKAFLDEGNPKTFLNRTESAVAAGYNASSRQSFHCIGSENYRILKTQIEGWLDQVGLSEIAICLKIIKLMNAKKIKFITHQGVILDQVEVEALGIQLQAVKLAAQVKGMIKDRREVSGPGGEPIHLSLSQYLDAIDGASRVLPSQDNDSLLPQTIDQA